MGDGSGTCTLALLAGSALLAGYFFHTYHVKSQRLPALDPTLLGTLEATELGTAELEGRAAAPTAAAGDMATGSVLCGANVATAAGATELTASEWISAWRIAGIDGEEKEREGQGVGALASPRHVSAVDGAQSSGDAGAVPLAAAAVDTATVSSEASVPHASPRRARVTLASVQDSGQAYRARLSEIRETSLGDVRRRVVSIGEGYQAKVAELWNSHAQRQKAMPLCVPPVAPAAGEKLTLDMPRLSALQHWLVGALEEVKYRLHVLVDRAAAFQNVLLRDSSRSGLAKALLLRVKDLVKSSRLGGGRPRTV